MNECAWILLAFLGAFLAFSGGFIGVWLLLELFAKTRRK